MSCVHARAKSDRLSANLETSSDQNNHHDFIPHDARSPVFTTKTILAKEGFACSLLTLAPGEETPRREADQIEDYLLFVTEGEVTVRYCDVNTMLGKDQAVLIRKGEQHIIAASPGGWTKILRVDVPPRQIVTPQIITPANSRFRNAQSPPRSLHRSCAPKFPNQLIPNRIASWLITRPNSLSSRRVSRV